MPHAYREGDKPVPGYTLTKFLGRGGFGQVWQALAPGGTKVAFKIIDLEGKQGLKEFRAVRLMRHVLHPNLVPIMAFWLKDDMGTILDGTLGDDADSTTFLKSKAAELLIAMGLGEKNLLDRLKECQRDGRQGIPTEELLDYMEAAARALDFLNSTTHDMGDGRPVAIQHCDIKPQNILIVGGAAQVCDFGLAREMGASRSTSPSVSIAYTPPEMLDGRSSLGTDQYSLAVTFIELRTGLLPFASENPAAMIYAHLQGRLDLTKLTPGERRVIIKATSLDPKDRYRSTIEMVRALREAAAPSQRRSPAENREPGPQLAAGRELVPGYRLLKSLGSGSYGAVWEAVGPGGTRMAFKIIQELDQAAGQQEYKALELIKGVEHKYLMEIFAYWLLDSGGQVIPDELRGSPDAPKPATLVIASKLAKSNLGLRLKECLAMGQQGIPVTELLRYMDQTAKAIDYLNAAKHRMGDKFVAIQHRDIKPENILLTANDDVKIADFGLAKVVEGLSTVIHTRSMGLTPYYAAPEMFDGRITKWTDQYCLAVSYCHMRTGVLPFRQVSSVQDIMRAHLQGTLDLGRLPGAERRVIAKALAVNPEQRYASCSEMIADLISACTDQLDAPIDESFMGATSLPPSVKKKRSKPPSHHGQVIKPIPPTKPVAPLPRTPRPKVPAEVMPRVPAVMESAEGLPTLSQHAPRAPAEPMLIPEAQDTDRPRGTAPLRPVLVIFSAVAKRLAFWRLSRRAKLIAVIALAIAVLAVVAWIGVNALAARSARRAVAEQIDAGNFADAWKELQARAFDPATKQELLTQLQSAHYQQAAAEWHKVTADESVAAYQNTRKLLAEVPTEALNAEARELLKQVQGTSPKQRAETCLQRAADQLDVNPSLAQTWYTRALQWSKQADGKTALAALLGRARAAIRLHPPAWEQARKDVDELAAAPNLSDSDRLYASAIDVLARNAAGTGDLLTRLKDLPRPDRFPLESSEEKSQVQTVHKELLKQAQEEFETAELSRARLIADALKQDDPKASIYGEVAAALGSDDAAKIKNLLIASRKPPRFAGLCAAYLRLAEKQADKPADPAIIQEMATTLGAALKAEWPGKEAERKDLVERQLKLMSLAVAARIKARLDEASAKLDNRQYSESRTILKELDKDKENLKPEDLLRRDTLQALVLVRDAKNAADRSQGAQLCFDLMAKGGSSREKDLCLALADVADAQGEYLSRAVGTLRTVKDRLTDKDRVGVEKRYGALAVKHFDLLEDQAYRQLGNAAEFAKLIKQAEAYENEIAEADLRLTTLRTLAGAKNAPGPETLGQLEKLLANKKTPHRLDLCRVYAGLREKETDIKQMAEAAIVLRDAGGQLTPGADKKEVARLETGFLAKRITVLAAGSAEQRSQALTEFRDLPLEDTPKNRLAEMCQALMALAVKNLNEFGDAGKGKLKAALDGVEGESGKQLRDQLTQLIGKGVKVLITTAASFLDAGEFDKCRTTLTEALGVATGDDKIHCNQLRLLLDLRDTDAAARRNRKTAIQAVAKEFPKLTADLKHAACGALADLVEQEPAEIGQISLALTAAAMDLPVKWRNLPAYVRIRELENQPEKMAAAADQISLETKALEGLGVTRRQYIAGKLERAAAGLRAGNSWLKPFGDSPEKASRASAWLSQAKRLLPEEVQPNPPVDLLHLRLNLALAAWYKPMRTDADIGDARRLAEELLKEHPKEDATFEVADALPLLLVHAQACAASTAKSDRLAALDSFARLIELLDALDDEAKMQPLDEYQAVLAPALEVTELGLDADAGDPAKAKAAQICSYVGNFLNQHVYLPVWAGLKPPLKVEQQVFECHKRAFQLVEGLKSVDNSTKARYLTDKFHARLHYAGENKLDEMQAEAIRANELAPDLPGGHGMVGYVIHQQARKQKNADRQKQLLDKAIEKYTEAINKCKAKGGFAAENLINLYNRSIAHGDLATIAEAEPKRDELYQAVADAQQAVDLLKTPPKPRNPEFAYMQLGAALEELAQFGDEYFDRYDAALAQYAEAAKLTRERKSGSKTAALASGRCRFRQARNKNSKTEPDARLTEVKNELQEVIDGAVGTREEAEARYWLAQVYALQGPKMVAESDTQFEKARRVAGSLPEKKVIADSWRQQAELALERAESAKDEPNVVRERLKLAVECTSELAKLDSGWTEDLIYTNYLRAANQALETGKKYVTNRELTEKLLATMQEAASGIRQRGEPPSANAEASLLLGKYYEEVVRNSATAIQEYTRGLPAKLTDPGKVHVGLLFRRNKLVFDELMIEARPDREKIEELIQKADLAVKWAADPQIGVDPTLRANTLYFAGYARTHSMGRDKRTRSVAEFELAADRLKEALRIAPANPENGWSNRFWLTYTFYNLMSDPQIPVNKRKDYYEEAVKVGQEAQQTAPPAARETIDALMQRIADGKPK